MCSLTQCLFLIALKTADLLVKSLTTNSKAKEVVSYVDMLHSEASTIRDLKNLLDQDIIDSEAEQTSSSSDSCSSSSFDESISPIISQ